MVLYPDPVAYTQRTFQTRSFSAQPPVLKRSCYGCITKTAGLCSPHLPCSLKPAPAASSLRRAPGLRREGACASDVASFPVIDGDWLSLSTLTYIYFNYCAFKLSEYKYTQNCLLPKKTMRSIPQPKTNTLWRKQLGTGSGR